MDKASMLYNKFKTMFLVGEGDSMISHVLNRSIAEQRQYEEAKKGALKRAEQAREQSAGERRAAPLTEPPLCRARCAAVALFHCIVPA